MMVSYPGLRHCYELNMALTRLNSADLVARFVAENVRSFNAVNVATACHLLAKMQSLGRQQRVDVWLSVGAVERTCKSTESLKL